MEDLTGKYFHNWEVVKRSENNTRGAAMWECRCKCGKISIISGSALRLGRSTGCYSCATKENGNAKIHGMHGTKIYKVWRNMKARCYYKKDKNYKDYGGRGITVCDEWKNDFLSFYAYVSKLPNFGKDGYTLDRINNNGNYEQGNVRWATRYEQTHNRKR